MLPVCPIFSSLQIPAVSGSPELSFRNVASAGNVPLDDDWFTWSILKLRLHERLSESQKKAVPIEFGFTKDVLEIRILKALGFYSKRRWGLDQEFSRLECLSIDHVPMTDEEM